MGLIYALAYLAIGAVTAGWFAAKFTHPDHSGDNAAKWVVLIVGTPFWPGLLCVVLPAVLAYRKFDGK